MKAEMMQQIKLFDWIRTQLNIAPYAFSIPNEGKRSPLLGKLMKRMGMRSGVSDIFIAIPVYFENEFFHGLFIEMKANGKSGKCGKATPNQLEFHKDMKLQGYYCAVCDSAEAAIFLITQYLKNQS